MLWSETVFVAASLTVLAVLARALRDGALHRRSAVLLLVAATVATSMRYTGLLLLGFVFVALLALPAVSLGARLRRALPLTIVSALPALMIVARNVALGQPPLGARTGGSYTLSITLSHTVSTLSQFVGLSTVAGVVAVITVGVLLLAAPVLAIRRRDGAALLVSTYVLFYLALIVISEVTTTIDIVDIRLLVPVAIPVLATVLYAVFALLNRLRLVSPARVLTVGLAGLIVVGLFNTAIDTTNRLRQSVTGTSSPLAPWLRGLSPGAGVVTANASELYWDSGHTPMINLPMASFYCSATCDSNAMAMIRRDVARGSIRYVVLSTPPSSSNANPYGAVGVRLTYERDIAGNYVYEASPARG